MAVMSAAQIGNMSSRHQTSHAEQNSSIVNKLFALLAGVVSNEGDLIKYFENYIMQPVLTKAMSRSDEEQQESSNLRYTHT